MINGKKTYIAATAQAGLGIVGIACFLKPDLVSVASAYGLTILTPDQALLSLALGVSQLIAAAKSVFSRMAIAKIKGD